MYIHVLTLVVWVDLKLNFIIYIYLSFFLPVFTSILYHYTGGNGVLSSVHAGDTRQGRHVKDTAGNVKFTGQLYSHETVRSVSCGYTFQPVILHLKRDIQELHGCD